MTMDYDNTKVDEVVLALLPLSAHTDHGVTRAWKGFDWDALDRLHAQGLAHLKPQVEGQVSGTDGRRGTPRRGVFQRVQRQGNARERGRSPAEPDRSRGASLLQGRGR